MKMNNEKKNVFSGSLMLLFDRTVTAVYHSYGTKAATPKGKLEKR